MLKIYLDDERTPPDGWVLARWPDEVVSMMESEEVSEISLDHDLGDDDRGTGYDVVLWVEERVFTDPNFVPPKMHVHSANVSARNKMEMGISRIERKVRERSS